MRLAHGVLIALLSACATPASLELTAVPEVAAGEWLAHAVPVADDLHLVAFDDAGDGWIVAHATGRVLRREGGRGEWREAGRLDSGYVEGLAVDAAGHAWVVGESGRLHATRDSGRTWTLTRVEPLYFGAALRPPAGPTWAFGSPLRSRTAVRVEWSESAEWRTRDTLDLPGAATAAVPAGDGSLLVATTRGVAWVRGAVASTVWTDTARAVLRGITSLGALALAVGHDGVVVRSEDSGRTWARVPSFTRNRLRDVRLLSERVAVAVGDANVEPGAMFETRDGGRTWRIVPSVGGAGLHRIAVSRGTVWVVGKGGGVWSRRSGAEQVP